MNGSIKINNTNEYYNLKRQDSNDVIDNCD